MRNGVMIDARDNVAVAVYELEAGSTLEFPVPGSAQMGSVVLNERIPLFHKAALADIAEGEVIVKYGEYMGVATSDIRRGDWVHTHNCASADSLKPAAGKSWEANHA